MQEGEAAKAARQMLNELMEERRWRIPQLADALGISVDIVRRWQQGKSRMQIDDVVAVAKLKGADLNQVFGLQPAASAPSSDVEELVDRKLERVFSRIMLAMAGAVNEASAAPGSNGHNATLAEVEAVPAPRPRRRK